MGHLGRPRVGAPPAARRPRRAATRSSSAAAPATSRPGWRGAARARSASTTPRRSSRRPAGSRREHGIDFPLLHGNAEAVPYPDASFDLAISEYGASIWADPYRWIPEAARLLRPGGRLIFLVNGLILRRSACRRRTTSRPTSELLRPYFGMHRIDWSDEEQSNFYLGYGDWIRLLRANGFEVEDLIELQAPRGATTDLPVRDAPSGRSDGRARRSGRRASAARRPVPRGSRSVRSMNSAVSVHGSFIVRERRGCTGRRH